MVYFFQILLISIYLISETLSQTQSDCPKERCLSNGQCVDSISLCPIDMSCPSGYTKTNKFTCSKEKIILPTQCPLDKQTCWDNNCVNDASQCPSMPTCPSSNTVRCPDNSCVLSPDDCPKYVACPSFIPIRCPNGDCRRSLKDCPGLIKCPNEFTVNCNDGSCRMTSDECEVPAIQTQCSDQTMTRCPDGTCTSSKFLCSTPKTCPVGFIMCWNGSCSRDFSQCDKPTIGQSNSCSSPNLVKCLLDGSCKTNISQCPTAIICPVDKPVRCWDFSCKESLEKCPSYQDCPEGTSKCNDGTCASNATPCGTHITCSMDAPFKCFDNTCRRNPSDCPTPVECSSKFPILCWDGKCVANRFDCLPPDACPTTEPLKCPDGMCRKNLDECKVITDCPIGFIRCIDGTCRRKLADCALNSCPLNFPYQCENGLCVGNLSYCDNKNGCPFYSPYKCGDGKCVKSLAECTNNNIEKVCGNSDGIVNPEIQLCPDGSCIPSSQPCPTETGCQADTPLSCANGSCIDGAKSKCPVPVCPPESPIKCADGLCVVTISACPNTSINGKPSEDCIGMVSCADGKCAFSQEECKPVFNCPVGFERCEDGSCRTNKEFCPKATSCPTSKPYRCSNGSCVVDSEHCLNISGCPVKTPIKCPNSGLCVNSMYKCNQYEELFPAANGCDKSIPLKCLNGKCVNNLNQCQEKSICKSDQVYCPNSGTCAKKLRDCVKLGDTCPEGYIRCIYNGLCKLNYEECLNASACPVKTPFRCVSGNCQRYPLKSLVSAPNDSCELGIQCPDYQPFICADGSCAAKSSFCNSFWECPAETPIRCYDRSCVATKDICEQRKRCPPTNPLLCTVSGNCVNNIFDCADDVCPPTAPYKCGNGKCVSSPRNCVVNELAKTTICTDSEATCYDGTCRPSIDHCPIYPGCTDSKMPYKCSDGSCAMSQSHCPPLTDDPPCSEGNSLCEDGICRKQCPGFSGCPNLKPLLCPTGICANSISECAGHSNCPIDTPFRCLDGSCVEEITLCSRAKRDFVGTDIELFVTSGVELDADIVLGESNDIIAAVKIPSNTFALVENPNGGNTTNTNSLNDQSATLLIKSVPASKLRNTQTSYNQTRQDDIIKVFPYADENNNFTLEYEYAVLSPVIEVRLKEDNISFKNLMILMLAYDFPHKHESLTEKNNNTNYVSLNPFDDVCLAKLNSEKNAWECTQVKSEKKSGVNFQLFGGIDKQGIYAVILAPLPDTSLIDSVPNAVAKYIMIILITAIVLAFVIAIGAYVFYRIYRYRGKYKESREESKKFEEKMQEMQMIGTNYLGQTLGDNLDNIIYTSNPSFRIVKEEGKNQRMEELQNLHDSMMKRYRVLEKNNEQLKKTHETLMIEYNRLQDYKEQLNKKDGNIMKTEENN